MENDVSVLCLLKGALEGLYQMMRQLSDKPDRIS